MAHVTKLSALADSFPTAEITYADLAAYPYRRDSRVGDGTGAVDCIGIALEVYARAGLGLPDPKAAGIGILAFQELFEQVSDPDQLYDLVLLRRELPHVGVVVRPEIVLSAAEKWGVHSLPINRVRSLGALEYWRLKDEHLP